MALASSATAATAAYLGTIPPDLLRSAVAYTHGSHWILVAGKLLTIAASLAIVRFALLVRIASAIGRRRPRPNLTVFAVGATALLLQSLLLLPWHFYADLLRERAYGLSNETSAAWLVQTLVLAVIGAIVGGALFVPFYAIIRRAGKGWWVWGSALAAIAIVGAISLAPYLGAAFNRYQPFPAGPVAAAVHDLAAKAGVPHAEVLEYDGSKQSDKFTASVTGTGANARIAISDTVLRPPVDLPAIRAVVAHEIGHYRHHHLLLLGLAVAALACLGLFVAARTFGAAARALGGRQIAGIADPAGIPVLLAISAAFTLVTTPLVNTAMRAAEADADRYGLDLAREPDGAARALLATTAYRAPSPSPVEEALFYDHPAIAKRIAAAMAWKQAHLAHCAARSGSAPEMRAGCAPDAEVGGGAGAGAR